MVVRRASEADSEAVTEVWLRSFDAALPTVRRAHSDDEVRAWFRNVVVPYKQTWVAVAGTEVVGLLVLRRLGGPVVPGSGLARSGHR